MNTRTDDRREGDLPQISPSHGRSGSLAGASSVASDSPEYSLDASSRGIRRGVCFHVCQECRRVFDVEKVALDDPRSGKATHDVCGACKPAVNVRTRLELGLPPYCACGAALEIDGKCLPCAEARELEGEAYLTGLGLWPLPGGVA